MKKLLRNSSFRVWLAIVGAATILIGAAYTMVQQSTRLATNDAPLAKAQQIKQELNSDAQASDTISAFKIDLSQDNNVFAIITDKDSNVLASSATLNGKTPLPPAGVFEFTKAHGSDHFTWQPSDKVRLTTEVLSYKDGFVITGQSLKPAEDRIGTYGLIALAAWLTVILWTFLVLLFPL